MVVSFSGPRPCTLAEPHARTAAVFVSELDDGRYQSAKRRTYWRPILLTLTHLQANADFASFIVGEVNAGMFKDCLYL
jgi:hypothetical protein